MKQNPKPFYKDGFPTTYTKNKTKPTYKVAFASFLCGPIQNFTIDQVMPWLQHFLILKTFHTTNNLHR